MRAGSASVAAVASVSMAACGDPLAENRVEELGSEAPYEDLNELHRPGQPCLVCHREGGSAVPFSVAGTVFADRQGWSAAPDVRVVIRDDSGRSLTVESNEAGNFFLKLDEFRPVYPFWTGVFTAGAEGPRETAMKTRVFREGSCAFCHTANPGLDSVGPIYVELGEGAP